MLNLYRPPLGVTAQDELHEHTPAAEYDINFCFPVAEELKSPDGGVVLTPLIPSLHAKALYHRFQQHPAMFRWLPYDHSTASFTSFLIFLETRRREASELLYVVFDQSLDFAEGGSEVHERDERRIAGYLGYIKASGVNLGLEMAHLCILPPFHRTHVTTHACALLLQQAFTTLSLRRVWWFSNSANLPSISCAARLGLKREALLRWERVLPVDKEGLEWPEGVDGEKEEAEGRGRGRHSVVLGLGWDEWATEGRATVERLMKREVKRRPAPAA